MSLLMYLTISQISNIAAHFSVSFRMSQEQRETENKSFLKRAEICKVGDVSPTFLGVSERNRQGFAKARTPFCTAGPLTGSASHGLDSGQNTKTFPLIWEQWHCSPAHWEFPLRETKPRHLSTNHCFA